MLRASLKVLGGNHDGEIIELAAPKFLIGREADCQLRPSSEMVSRHHCAFAIDDYSVRLRDLGSTNGTFVNDERLRGVTQLNDGDTIRVGKLTFQIQLGDSAHPEAEPAEASPLASETAEMSSEETHYEIPSVTAQPPTEIAETQSFAMPEPEPEPAEAVTGQQPVEAQQQQPQAPQPYPMQPGQYVQQPGYYAPPMGYPAPMPGYYPQYPQQPYPYPVVMGQPYPATPGYPQQPAPPPEQQQQQQPQQQVEQDSSLEVKLPDPSTTGAKDAPAPGSSDAPSPAPDQKNPSDHAADIIRRHLQRRPGDE